MTYPNFIKLSLMICFLVNYNNILAQDVYEIKLTKCISSYPFNGGLIGTEIINDSNAYKIPKDLKDYIIKKHPFNRDNEYKFKDGISRDYISILININSDSSKTVIVDANNDLDFTDDKFITYTKEKSNNEGFFVVQLIYQSELINYYLQTVTYPKYIYYNNKNEQDHYLIIKSHEAYTGLVKIDDKYYQIFLQNRASSPYYQLKDLALSISDSSGNYMFYNSNEVIDLEGNKILVDSISVTGEKLFVKIYKKSIKFAQNGFTRYFYLKPFKTKDYNGENIEIPIKNKHTLLDFWGTWCGPCKELTPRLVLLNDKYKGYLSLISFAGNSKAENVKEYVDKNRMNWIQIVENNDNSEIFSKKMFAINIYPTFILIDRNGKIVFRGYGKEGLVEVENILARDRL